MFYCFGDNRWNGSAIGAGETIEAAICTWANETDLHLASDIFSEFEPTVIEGNIIQVVFNTTVSKAV